MAVVNKFMFDQEFGDTPPRRQMLRDRARAEEEAAAEAPPPPPPPPMFSEQELELARDEAFAAGKRAGIHEAEAATQRLAATALQMLAGKMQALERHYIDLAARRERNAVRAALAVAKRLLPIYAEREGLAELEALFAEALSHLAEEPRLIVRVHESLADETRERLTPLAAAAGFEGRLVVVADSAIAPGDGRVEWAEGGIERNHQRFWQDIDAAVARSLGAEMEPDEMPAELD